jgi:hypothetical protein
MADVWKKAEEALEVGDDEGDILSVLKRVQEQYSKHILRIVQRSDHGMNLTAAQELGINFYADANRAVHALIEQ